MRSNFLFVGPPGTGKTLLVNLFAQKLGIRMFFLSLEGKSDVDILGSSWGQDGKSKLGELDQAFLEFEGKEGILVLDEGVKTINSSKMLTTVFLKLLESSETNYYSIFLDREIPISNVVMIILDNENFEDLALDQRVFKVEFNGYNLDQKYQVLIDKIIPRFKELLEFNFNLSAKDKAYLRQMLKAVKNEEGFRTIEKGVLSWIVEKKIFSKGIKKKKLNFPKVLKDQLKFNSQQYNSYVNSR